ncbi:acyltransferase [Clostridium sp. HCP1S3_B4]|uniref:acyltransferase n=1 Tax=unclassified Clostridium TaxID=2614128 RepID=UPI003F8BE76B
MINKVMKLVYKLKVRSLKWGSIKNFNIGKGYIVIGSENIFLGDFFYAEDNLRLQAWKSYGNQSFNPLIKIGKHVSMMENCQISCCNKILIGDGCLFGANVFITDNFHGNNSMEQNNILPINRPLEVKGSVCIGKNVWIGRNVCIMPGVAIGDGAIIGSNAVVTHDIPEKSVAVGVPAKVIKQIN